MLRFWCVVCLIHDIQSADVCASSSQQQKEIQLLQQQINVQFEDHSLEVKKLRRELQACDEELARLREQVSDDTLQGYLNEIAVLNRKLESKDRLLRAKVGQAPGYCAALLRWISPLISVTFCACGLWTGS